MRSVRHFVLLAAAATAAASITHPTPAAADDDGAGVYLLLAESVPMTFDAVASTLEDALLAQGWTVLAPLDCGVDAERCDFRSRVLVAYHAAYVDLIMAHGTHAAYAAPIRFAIFEDENGVHISATNPMNLNRTIVEEETTPEDWAWAADMIREVGIAAFPDHSVTSEYGQLREKSRIGRTFGIMAGGKFIDKIETLSTVPAEGTSAARIADLVLSQIGTVDGEFEWGTRPVYVLDLPEHGVSIMGLSGSAIEARAFGIVGAGGNDDRKDLACPGIDHAPAFPIEVVFAEQGGNIVVTLVDEMYRMKMFFEDAGKMSFAKNMGMPGSIEDEIRTKIQAILN